MTPSEKSPQLDDAITRLFGVDRRKSIHQNRCVDSPIGCGLPIDGFRDEGSAREFSISGMCQKCQDEFFGT